MDMDNHFIALLLDKALEKTIELTRAPLLDSLVKKPIRPHITLLPPPLARRYSTEQLSEMLHGLSNHKPFEAKTNELAMFRRSVLHIPVDHKQLHEMQAELMVAAKADLYKAAYVGAVTFRPHITLLQAKKGVLTESKIDRLRSNLVYPEHITLRSVGLFQQTGPRKYRVVDTLEL